jgi:sensor histidine kinase regulating citrate/malate metabolism
MSSKQTENECGLLGDQWEADHNLRLIRLFNHYRHDWMNEIQLVFGYVKLKKYDKLEALLENIKARVQQESHISKLGVPELIVYLFSVQAEFKELKLEIDMDHEIHLNELPMDCEEVGRLLIALIEAFKNHARIHGDNEHDLRIKLIQAVDKLQVDCAYQGIAVSDPLLSVLKQVKQQIGPHMTWKTNQRDGLSVMVSIEVLLNI